MSIFWNRIIICLSIFLFANTAKAKSSSGPFGLGIILGVPTAISGKLWLDQRSAIDMGLAFSFNDYIFAYGDYLVHFPGALSGKEKFLAQITPYFGIGALIAVTSVDRSTDDRFLGRRNGSIGLGLRIPLGVEWQPVNPSLGVFVEIAPGISIIPQTSAIFEAGIGVRYYF